MKIMVSSFKRSHAHTAALNASDPEAGHCWSKPPLETPGHSWANLSHFLVGSLLLSPASWCSQGFVCALQESVSSVLCKFWWFYGGVGGDFLQEDLCHTQVCCTQSPCSRPLLTCTLTGDTQTWFWLRPVGWTCILCPSKVWAFEQPGAWQAHCPRWTVHLNHIPSLAFQFPGCTTRAPYLRCAVCLLWRADLRLLPSWMISAIQDLRKTWLAAGSLLTVWWKTPSLELRL